MPYERLNIRNGDILTENHLRHFEDGILNSSILVSQHDKLITQNKQNIYDINSVIKTGLDTKTNVEKVIIYYGYPVGINNAWSVDAAVDVYKKYDICVFGDTYELPDHEVYSETVEIFTRLKEENPDIRLVGYVPIGAQNIGEDSGLSITEIKRRIDLWKNIKADGIFLDEFGYDYGVTRERQNEVVQYVHDKSMFCIANTWNQSYAFSSQPMVIDFLNNFKPNPNSLLPLLNEHDYSLLENMFYSCERDESTKKVTLKSASCWRVDDGYAYYSREQSEYGTTYYKKFGTKLLLLDAIPHSLSSSQKTTLMTLSFIGAKIFNIPALAFGDEDWGSSGYYYDWDIPTAVDFSENKYDGIHGVTVENRGPDNSSFPYKWSANIRGNTLTLVFDVNNGEDETYDANKRYVMVNDTVVKNLWQTIYEFSEDMKNMESTVSETVTSINATKKQVEDAIPTVTSAEQKIQQVVADANTQIESMKTTVESALADVAGVTSGFGFKEVQW